MLTQTMVLYREHFSRLLSLPDRSLKSLWIFLSHFTTNPKLRTNTMPVGSPMFDGNFPKSIHQAEGGHVGQACPRQPG